MSDGTTIEIVNPEKVKALESRLAYLEELVKRMSMAPANLTVDQLAERWDLSEMTIYRKIRDPKNGLKYSRKGKKGIRIETRSVIEREMQTTIK